MITARDIQLVGKFLDGDITSSDFAELEQRLQEDADVRRRLRSESNIISGLSDLAAGSRFSECQPPPVRSHKRRFRILTVITACALIAVTAFILRDVRRDGIGPHIGELTARVAEFEGDVRLKNTEGQSRPAAAGAVLSPGETLETHGVYGFAAVVYSDDSRLAFGGNSVARFPDADPKNLLLQRGVVTATVVPGSAQPDMVITTPNDEIKVVGTEFTVAASDTETDLEVTRGKVILTRVTGGSSVVVEQGQQITTEAKSSDLSVLPLDKPNTTWTEDFENGRRNGWAAGELETTDLPNESKAGLRAVIAEDDPQTAMIQTPSRWKDGLFQVMQNTHLHITFKVTKPGWVNMFCLFRDQKNVSPTWLGHCGTVPFWHAKAGVWQTMIVPMSLWQRKDETKQQFENQPPAAGAIVNQMLWATKVDRGLVIDRVQVTTNGPGEMQILDVTTAENHGDAVAAPEGDLNEN